MVAFPYSKNADMTIPKIAKIIIADDHQIFIEGLKTVLREMKGEVEIEIIGEANTGISLLKMLEQKEADLLLLDMNLPDMDGLEILSKIRINKNDIKIITLTMYDESKIVKSAFRAGVDGYILKSNGVNELYEGIKEVLKGNTFMGTGVGLTNGFTSKTIKPGRLTMSYEDRFIKKYHLTKREMEVLKLISQALSNKEIGKELYISDQTVSVHRKNIMRKLGVSNTAGLIKAAYDNSLI